VWRAVEALVALALVFGCGGHACGASLVAEARAVTVPSHDLEVVSPVVNAVIKDVLVKEGDRVAKGDPLVQLDAEVQRASLAISEHKAKSTARLEAAEANLRVKRAAYARQKTLHDRGVSSDAELEVAELELRHAESLVTTYKDEQAQNRLQAKRDRVLLERMTIRAPLTGVVRRCLKDVGEAAKEAEALINLVVLGELHVIAHVEPEVAAQLAPGKTGEVCLDSAPDQTHKCKILHVDSVADAGSSTCRVKLCLPNPDGTLMAGSRGTVRFSLPPKAGASTSGRASAERRK
jgi:membrane fusion protein (multidrug efflux system)